MSDRLPTYFDPSRVDELTDSEARSLFRALIREWPELSRSERDGETPERLGDPCPACGKRRLECAVSGGGRALVCFNSSCQNTEIVLLPPARDGETLSKRITLAESAKARHKGAASCEFPNSCGACHFWSGYIGALTDLANGESVLRAGDNKDESAAHVIGSARDGETLSDERAILSDDQVELIREEARSTATAEGFMLAHGSPTAHDILLLCDSHAALRAQLADARADNRRVALIQEYCFARNISWRGLIDDLAARAASGEDASNQQTGRARSEESDNG